MLGPDSAPHAEAEAQALLVEDTLSLALVDQGAFAKAGMGQSWAARCS